MTNVFSDQKEFLTKSGQLESRQSEDVYLLYLQLIEEELDELRSASTPSERFDAILDIIYVTIGAGNVLGFPLEKGWIEVHASNMAKFLNDMPVIHRTDGKVLKPEGWLEPDLQSILDGKPGNYFS